MRMVNVGAARDAVDEVELAEAAIFSLNQAARRLRTLADQARSTDLQPRSSFIGFRCAYDAR